MGNFATKNENNHRKHVVWISADPPSAADDINSNRNVGDFWFATGTKKLLVCKSNAVGAAYWAEAASGIEIDSGSTGAINGGVTLGDVGILLPVAGADGTVFGYIPLFDPADVTMD